MSQTKRSYNKRKAALNRLVREMEKEGYIFKKIIKNSVRFVHKRTGDKKWVNLEIIKQ